MKKVLFIFGTRPEAIKMAPLVNTFKKKKAKFKVKVCVTAQHREMLDQVLEFFEITPDYDLDLMKPGQNLYSLTATIIDSLKPILEGYNPDFVFVHGDTTTTMASSIASFYSGARLCHIEAGLRTFNKHSPFPEEINRQVTGRIADFHFTPTKASKENLIKENIEANKILITGNTVIDALLSSVKKVENQNNDIIKSIKRELYEHQEVILVTGHRRENHGEGFDRICLALREIAKKKPEIKIIYPVHLNPNVQEPVNRLLSGLDNILLIPPLSYPDFIWLMNRSKIIITDSGGVQEEAPSLGKPVLVMRDTTERPEAVEAGTVILVGTNIDRIVNETFDLLDNPNHFKRMSELHNPYGDGNACRRILNFIESL
jgi:UDP-N-acetylglucosamine 2-epimerase (non-hydrolysing)